MLNISAMVMLLFESNTINIHYNMKIIMIKNILKNKFSTLKNKSINSKFVDYHFADVTVKILNLFLQH